MNYLNLSYIIFLLLVILTSLFVHQVFSKKSEGMVTIGDDLTATTDIPSAQYGMGKNNGLGIDAPSGYYKINISPDISGGVWKMKPVIPTGFIIDPSDKTKLIVDPKNDNKVYSVSSYEKTTLAQLNQSPYEDIPGVNYATGETGELTPLPTNNKDTKGNTIIYYRVKTSVNGLDRYVMKKAPTPFPNGFDLDSNGNFFLNITKYALSTFDSAYNPSNTDISYNVMPTPSTESINNDDFGKYYSFDSNGQLIREENTDASFSPVLYYIPGAYKYGSSNYVPNYEDSVYLSRTTRLPQQAPVYNTAGMLGGFCTQYKNDKFAIEEKCGALDLNTCASTSCCTLIGGQKCVAGSENGPSNPANYSDGNLRNKDFYYYQGKCYGNCNS
jgi:hypothetical protein